MSATLPLLYSFRRCPYAMRARLGLLFAKQPVMLREVVLKNKPKTMLALSPKGTVPVLALLNKDGSLKQVIEESLEIIEWALSQHDPEGLLNIDLLNANTLIEQNDNQFKHSLNRYKYAERYPEFSQLEYRQQGELFLQQLENLLAKTPYLLGEKISIADIAIMPFVRQFAHVDREVFYRLPYPNLQLWLRNWLENPIFKQVMVKHNAWQAEDEGVLFPS